MGVAPRRLVSVSPAAWLSGSRRLSSTASLIAAMKKSDSKSQDLAPHLAESLKPLASTMTSFVSDIEKFAVKYPEATEEYLKKKLANPLAAGIVATTEEPRDPSTCKYTTEGSIVHDFVKEIYQCEREKVLMMDGVEVTLAPDDYAAKCKTLNDDAIAFLKKNVEQKMALEADMEKTFARIHVAPPAGETLDTTLAAKKKAALKAENEATLKKIETTNHAQGVSDKISLSELEQDINLITAAQFLTKLQRTF